jgi:hypothetical protein
MTRSPRSGATSYGDLESQFCDLNAGSLLATTDKGRPARPSLLDVRELGLAPGNVAFQIRQLTV